MGVPPSLVWQVNVVARAPSSAGKAVAAIPSRNGSRGLGLMGSLHLQNWSREHKVRSRKSVPVVVVHAPITASAATMTPMNHQTPTAHRWF